MRCHCLKGKVMGDNSTCYFSYTSQTWFYEDRQSKLALVVLFWMHFSGPQRNCSWSLHDAKCRLCLPSCLREWLASLAACTDLLSLSCVMGLLALLMIVSHTRLVKVDTSHLNELIFHLTGLLGLNRLICQYMSRLALNLL